MSTIWEMAFVLVMLLTAAGSSSEQLDGRNTSLTLKPEGLHFKNGLAGCFHDLGRGPNCECISHPGLAARVNVAGDPGHFNFRTMVESTTKTGQRSLSWGSPRVPLSSRKYSRTAAWKSAVNLTRLAIMPVHRDGSLARPCCALIPAEGAFLLRNED